MLIWASLSFPTDDLPFSCFWPWGAWALSRIGSCFHSKQRAKPSSLNSLFHFDSQFRPRLKQSRLELCRWIRSKIGAPRSGRIESTWLPANIARGPKCLFCQEKMLNSSGDASTHIVPLLRKMQERPQIERLLGNCLAQISAWPNPKAVEELLEIWGRGREICKLRRRHPNSNNFHPPPNSIVVPEI